MTYGLEVRCSIQLSYGHVVKSDVGTDHTSNTDWLLLGRSNQTVAERSIVLIPHLVVRFEHRHHEFLADGNATLPVASIRGVGHGTETVGGHDDHTG